MSNAKDELLELLKENKLILKCAELYDIAYDRSEDKEWLLPLDYTSEAFEDFLKQIDFEYDSSYGSQELGGTLWFTNGTWADRGEYDGSEWWEYHELPEIPAKLQGVVGNVSPPITGESTQLGGKR